MGKSSKSSIVRERLDHPVIDADGHYIEYVPALRSYLRAEGAADAERLVMLRPFVPVQFPASPTSSGNEPDSSSSSGGPAAWNWYGMSPAERYRNRSSKLPWRGVPTRKTEDLATIMLPPLLYSRLDELGIDFAVLYPTVGLTFCHLGDEDLRRGACRAINTYNADVFDGLHDRLEPVAVIPMHTPQEAVEELEHAVSLGFKAVVIPSFIKRPIPVVAEKWSDAAPYAVALDTFGIDSPHDYDPFWAKCVELGISPASHTGSHGFGTRQSISSFAYNHIGHFGASGEAALKSLFLGGVTRRFPQLRIAALEGGVAWGASLYCDLIGTWQKRNIDHIGNYAPTNVDPQQYTDLFKQYAPKVFQNAIDPQAPLAIDKLENDPDEVLDEFAACGITKAEDIAELFIPNFYFGCEADDAMTPIAFKGSLPFGARLNAMLSSDIGHWDVPDITEVIEEAWEAVEDGHLTTDDFRDFSFNNVVRFYSEANPHFFDGTIVADAAKQLHSASQPNA